MMTNGQKVCAQLKMISFFSTIVIRATILTLCNVWFAHTHILHDDKMTIGKCMIENDLILFNHCDDNDSTHTLCCLVAHLHILHNDKMTIAKCMIENDIILLDHCDMNDSTHTLCCYVYPSTYSPQ